METSQEIKDRYAIEAETYRRDAWLVNFDSEMLFDEFRRIIKKLYNREDKINILDIGAGNGMLTEVVLSEFPNANVTMLDFSTEMLESAKAIFEKNNISLNRIKISIRDFITDEFPNEKYDLVISSYALHHVRNENDLRKVYLKIVNSLNEYGTFLCLDYYLEENDVLRQEQVRKAFDRWAKNFNSEQIAKEWGNIIKEEDTPATIALILSLLNECNTVPLLSPLKGVLATIYGTTLLGIERLSELQLTDYTIKPDKFLSKEKKISRYPF